mgnify:CR=1
MLEALIIIELTFLTYKLLTDSILSKYGSASSYLPHVFVQIVPSISKQNLFILF